MGFDDLNREVKSSSGEFVKLTKREHGTLEGRVVNVTVRNKQFQGKDVVSSKTGEPRKEWLFTLDVDGETKKFAAVESAQFAIRNALDGREMQPNSVLKIAVTEDSIPGKKSAEYKARYTPPAPGSFKLDDAPAPVEDDEPDF